MNPPAFDLTQNRYAVVRAITRRSRHLFDGAPPLGASASLKPCRQAEEEYRAGLIAFRIVEKHEHALHLVKSV